MFSLQKLSDRVRQLGIAEAAKTFNEAKHKFDIFLKTEENMETMSKGKLYEYAVIYHPKHEKDKVNRKSELLGEVTRVLAASDAEVSILAARSIPVEKLDHLDDIEILVRPF